MLIQLFNSISATSTVYTSPSPSSTSSVLPTTTSMPAATSIPGLVGLWTFNANVKNTISSVSLFNQHQASTFTSDRRGRARSAFYINNGYAQLPKAVFFAAGDYTTTMWIYLLKNVSWQTVYVLRTAALGSDLVSLRVAPGGWMRIANGASSSKQNLIENAYKLNKLAWTHVAVVYETFELRCYANATLVATNVAPYASGGNVMRESNFFGTASEPLSAYLDDVMFFNRALDDQQLQITMLSYI